MKKKLWGEGEVVLQPREENELIDYRWHQTGDTVLQNYTKELLARRLKAIIISCPLEWLKNTSSLCII